MTTFSTSKYIAHLVAVIDCHSDNYYSCCNNAVQKVKLKWLRIL